VGFPCTVADLVVLKISKNISKNNILIFGSIEKICFEKVENIFGHQYRSEISLRIEWEYSQPLKTTLKHSLQGRSATVQ